MPAAGRDDATPPQRVLVSGASGFIGQELQRQLREHGHEVLRLVRREPVAPDERAWRPSEGSLDPRVLDEVDAVINLAGASLSRLPWTPAYKRLLVSSRAAATATITNALAAASAPPSVLLNGSAVGFYGDRPDEDLTENSAQGSGFLAELVAGWEGAAHLAPAGIRVVTFRTGLVVGTGGAFTPLGLLTRFGLGSRLGSGEQRWPWISLHDEAAAIMHLLASTLEGPVNLAGPTPATSDAVTRRLAFALHRPRIWSIPKPLIEVGLGTAGRELLLSSQRVIPRKLLDDGFVFRHESVEDAIRATWPA